MPLNKQAVTYFDFVNGLNTEISPLAAEPNDILDMNNCTILYEKAIAVRNGFEFIGTQASGDIFLDSTTDFSTLTGTFQYPAINFHIASTVTTAGTKHDYLLLQDNREVKIYDYVNFYGTADLSTPKQTITTLPWIGQHGFYRNRYSVFKNRILVANPKYPLYTLIYDEISDAFTFTHRFPKVRNLNAGAPPDSFVNNKGFYYQCIQSHASSADKEPGVGSLWESYWRLIGKELTDADDWVTLETADVWHWEEDFTNVTDYGEPDRRWVLSPVTTGEIKQYDSSIITLNDDPLCSTNIVTSGRVWLSGFQLNPNRIYFSQTLVSGEEYLNFYQAADPKNAEDADVVDTDGGYITLYEVNTIYQLLPFKNGVLVFADTGVWYIGGVDKAFTPTSYIVVKVSDDGAVSPDGAVAVEDACVYMGASAVYLITLQDLQTSPAANSLTDKKLKRLYTSIPMYNKQSSKIIYDRQQREIKILTNLSATTWLLDHNPNRQPVVYRDMLIFNLKLEAWYKHSLVTDEDGSKVYIADAQVILGGAINSNRVTDNIDQLVITEAGDAVVSFASISTDESVLPLYLFAKRNGDSVSYAFGSLGNTFYQDFVSSAEDVEDYDAFFTTSYQIFKDVAHQKQTPYIYPVFKRLETGIIDDATGEDITSGSCLMRVSWDFATGAPNPKYGVEREVYFPYKLTTTTFDGSLPGTDVVLSKVKLRGRGRSVQLTFSKNGAKGFHLYGFQLELTASPRV